MRISDRIPEAAKIIEPGEDPLASATWGIMKKGHWGILIIILAVVIMLAGLSGVFGRSLALITLRVVDEKGDPVQNAKVGVGFMIYTKGGWDSTQIEETGRSDKKGLFSASAISDDNLGFTINKEGYYQSSGNFKFKEHSFGRWQPWNPEITVVLRKIGKTVPMYARDTHMMFPALEIPVVGKAVGFDLMAGDWVDPYGRGEHADMFFTLTRQFVSYDDFDGTLTITFPDRYDGIQLVKYNRSDGSDFKLPRYAPEEGYLPKLVRVFGKKPGEPYKDSSEEDNNYFFRVRSEEKEGKFIRAMYGKIHGDIRFGLRDSKTASIVFKYFLNPDYTRNLEWNGETLVELRYREILNAN